MALGKNCSSEVKCGGLKRSISDVSEKEVLAVVPSRKRVISDCIEMLSDNSRFETPLKNRCVANADDSRLEALPQDILVKILCGVDHDDLKQLFHVSNKIRDATLIAKQWHFAFSTPSSKTRASKFFSDLEEPSKLENNEAPNAPRQDRSYRPRISGKKLAGITVALFRSTEDEQWSRNGLLVETVV
ncbi:F-box domain [Macleaya cordata]|uniref:F-box domain n=1 Tax=Macleaya cordata TaxID=56857 RepID=A0A200RBW1_MACCD|nr:F-box domain [Macleaya cordata]